MSQAAELSAQSLFPWCGGRVKERQLCTQAVARGCEGKSPALQLRVTTGTQNILKEL